MAAATTMAADSATAAAAWRLRRVATPRYHHQQVKAAADLLMTCEDTAPVDTELGAAVKAVWADAAVQKAWFRRSEFQVRDSARCAFPSCVRPVLSAGAGAAMAAGGHRHRPPLRGRMPPRTAAYSGSRSERQTGVWQRRGSGPVLTGASPLRPPSPPHAFTPAQIVESMSYFLNQIDRIAADDYVADINDMLHVRIRSSGVVVDRYTIDGFTFEMYDVGGQRNERKKWIHCFDNVTAVIYVAALSEYDQVRHAPPPACC